MPDRLKELQRQRALAQEQLAWFDREIAAASAQMQPAAGSASAVPAREFSTPPAVPQSGSNTATVLVGDPEAAAETILAQYREQAKQTPANIKRGCYLYLLLALGLLGIGFAVAYFLYTH
jgi:hypothetical protein